MMLFPLIINIIHMIDWIGFHVLLHFTYIETSQGIGEMGGMIDFRIPLGQCAGRDL